jgi:hypothetical protein
VGYLVFAGFGAPIGDCSQPQVITMAQGKQISVFLHLPSVLTCYSHSHILRNKYEMMNDEGKKIVKQIFVKWPS